MSGITTETLTAENELVRESVKEVLGVVKSGEGTFVAGQCFKFDSGSMKLVKTTTGAGFVRVALEAGDATSADVMVNMLAEGTVNGFKLVGVDYIVSDNEMSTPDAPTTELVSGGTLTAATHEYKAAGTNDNGSTTVSGASTAVTTHVATAGLPIEKTVKIILPDVAGATGFRLWRSIGGGAYAYRDVTAAEFAQGYVLDNGGLTWTAGTAVTATDFATLQLAENHSLFVEEVTSGYNFRA